MTGANWRIIELILLGVLLLDLVLQLTATAIALGFPVDVSLVVNLAISALFIFVGNYLGKLRRNFWGGIRTPWALASDVMWERTHRLGGWLFVMGGLLGLILSFIPHVGTFGIVTIGIVITLASAVYSFLVYQRLSAGGNEPLSPPFDNSGRV
jgi:uncharacterized membrane protein